MRATWARFTFPESRRSLSVSLRDQPAALPAFRLDRVRQSSRGVRETENGSRPTLKGGNMPNTAFVNDDEIAESVRTITRQRNTKRLAVLGAFILGLLGFAYAIG